MEPGKPEIPGKASSKARLGNRWRKGVSGNPAGYRKGSRHKSTLRQYGRLRQRGYSHEQSAARGTNCQKCTTAFVRNATAPICTEAHKSG
jgi:hypothetical protein